MAGVNLVGQNCIHAAAFALVSIIVSACSVSRVSPEYVPQGVLGENGLSGVPVVIGVVDHITNTAPAQSGASGFLLFHHNPAGEQLICDTCTYQFAASPVELVRQFVSSALLREGATLASDGSKRVEVQLLQFEFFEPARTSPNLNWQGRVGLRVIVTDRGTPVVDGSHLETSAYSSGPTVFHGGIEEWVSQTTSLSVEHVLSDPRIFEALKIP